MADYRTQSPAAPQGLDPDDGVLLVDKPSGPTSHDIVDAIRRRFGIRKVGHGGTLDPQATGLLLILLGRGTKLSDQFMGSDKVYEGCLRLGAQTDSQDADGKVILERPYAGITRDMVAAEMATLQGDIYQTPPMVSAVKVNGVPLHKLARKGKTVEREARLIHIYRFEMTDFSLPDVRFTVECSKGTYVRTLCDTIGEALGCGGHLASLRRTRSGRLSVDQAFTLDTVTGWTLGELREKIIPIAKCIGSRSVIP